MEVNKNLYLDDVFLVEKKIFNPDGDDSLNNRKIIKGNPTNLCNLNNVKYNWSVGLFRRMLANHWLPDTISLSQDKKDYYQLSEYERNAFESILSFLSYLDSVQTTNLPNVSDFITAPEVSRIFPLQVFQETIHSYSYQYIIDSIIPVDRKEHVHELWRNNQFLLERNKYIAQIYQDFIDDKSERNLSKVLIANYVLESIYFYVGFMFFYNLSNKNLMMGCADEIRYINTDELTHVEFFRNIILEIKKEYPDFFNEQDVHDLFRNGVDAENAWNETIIKNIDGMSAKDSAIYTEQKANKMLIDIGFNPLSDVTHNPYSHIEFFGDSEGQNVKSNFFESKPTNYSQENVLNNWEEISDYDLSEYR